VGRCQPAVLTYPDTNGTMNLAACTSTLPLPPIPGADQTFPVQEQEDRPHTRTNR
jgi:hypothetical protein